MPNGRKKAVSLRLSMSDIQRVKRIAQRLGVRDSDIIRYAIKDLLLKLSPLSDGGVRGRALVPLFLESGAELAHQFDLDAQRLDAIINEGVEEPHRVSVEDLHLLAMSGAARPPAPTMAARQSPGSAAVPVERRASPMRRYLYDKYLYGTDRST